MISLSDFGAICTRHLYFVGPGLVNSVAYIDPGNYATDLQAGALFGESMQFVVLTAGLTAVLAQVLALRLGIVTGLPLATHIRLAFERLEAKYPKRRRALRACLWSLYVLAEIAIISTDLAELIGSAIALNLLFPSLPLWAGVLITTGDVLFLLLFFSGEGGRKGMFAFELVIVFLVVTVFASFVALLHLVKPGWRDVFFGVLPSKTIFQAGALYDGIGIIGATIMPHALYLGSFIATADRLEMRPVDPRLEQTNDFNRTVQIFNSKWRRTLHRQFWKSKRASSNTFRIGSSDHSPVAGHEELVQQMSTLSHVELERENACEDAKERHLPEDPPLSVEDEVTRYEQAMISFDRIRWTDLHVYHATADTTFALLGFALTINAAILTVAATVYYYDQWDANPNDASIQGAFALMKKFLGDGPAIVFAIALLSAGQSASITVTLAGQAVSEGFIQWKTSPITRRMVTRLIGVVPSSVVAAAVGPAGLNTMLVASQVALSLVLPFAMFPLVWLCSRRDLMTITGPAMARGTERDSGCVGIDSGHSQTNFQAIRTKSYKSPLWLTVGGYIMVAVIVLADGYVIVELGLGVS